MSSNLRYSIAPLAAAALLLGACAHTGAPTLSTERIAEILASPDRRAADRTNDIRRKPQEMLAFIGLRPGMVALDLSAGGGYTAELIARSVGPTGRVYGQSRLLRQRARRTRRLHWRSAPRIRQRAISWQSCAGSKTPFLPKSRGMRSASLP